MSDYKLVYSDEGGDLRKKSSKSDDLDVIESEITLHIRRLTSGKGRTILEITNLPSNQKWCKGLAKELKKKLGVGGAFKKNYIEIHGEKFQELSSFLETKGLKFKKVGG